MSKILVGTKSDKVNISKKLHPKLIELGYNKVTEKEVYESTASEYATLHNMDHLETSSKTNNNIEEAFLAMASTILQNIIKKGMKPDRPTGPISPMRPIGNSSWCCKY